MPKKILLLLAFFKKEFITFRRYWQNSLGSMLTLYIVFLLLFGGYQGLRGVAGLEGNTVEAVVVGYVLWIFMLSTYQDIWWTIRRESQEGTLEQLYMSVHGFGWVMGAKVAASFFINLVFVAVFLVAALLTTGTTLNLDLPSLFPLLIGVMLGMLGVGFAVGGVTLIIKRIDSYTQMIQFLLIALIAVPAERVLWMRLLPGSFGAGLIRGIMIDGQNLAQLGLSNLITMFLIGVLHLVLGYGIYKLCERKAMLQGMLGHY